MKNESFFSFQWVFVFLASFLFFNAIHSDLSLKDMRGWGKKGDNFASSEKNSKDKVSPSSLEFHGKKVVGGFALDLWSEARRANKPPQCIRQIARKASLFPYWDPENTILVRV